MLWFISVDFLVPFIKASGCWVEVLGPHGVKGVKGLGFRLLCFRVVVPR